MSGICPAGSSMEITQQVRDYARQRGLDEDVEAGLSDESEAGGEIYS